ncbi:hypothetical protein ILYODFUR_028433 [Ilyodon furcidens]|uniref:Uncharacterized protein n=1 Tax=Ilyodon furcidens TaxID=33524 RepID=A0ABV0TCY8_9TELE
MNSCFRSTEANICLDWCMGQAYRAAGSNAFFFMAVETGSSWLRFFLQVLRQPGFIFGRATVTRYTTSPCSLWRAADKEREMLPHQSFYQPILVPPMAGPNT